MDFSEMADALAIETPIMGTWVKEVEKKQGDQPCQRRFHSTVIHKSSLFIYGGIPFVQAQDHFNEQQTAYRYNFNNKQWNRFQTHFLNNNSFSYLYAHATAVYNNMMYIFGGKNYKTNTYLSGLWCLNLESYNWKRQELKGYYPSPREHAAMILHQRSSLILYGGRNGKENLNDFHIYRIDNKMWLQIEQESYDLKIPCRLKPALCSQGEHIYFFGGQRMVTTEFGTQNVLLKDFYQLKLLNRPMSSRPDVWVKQIITNYGPTERVATFVNVGEKYLALWGGQNFMKDKKDVELGFWLYVITDINWIWVGLSNKVSILPMYGSTINYSSQKFYIFGQFNVDLAQQIPMKDQKNQQIKLAAQDSSGFIVLGLEIKEIQSKVSDIRFRPRILDSADRQCWECNEHSKSLEQHKLSDFTILQQMLEDQLDYPFSAFGLLVDNSLTLSAKESRVVFHHTFKEKYILFEDNGVTNRLWSNNAEFINDLLVMRTYVEENIDQIEEQEKEEDVTKKNCIPQSPVHHPTNILNKENKDIKESKEQKELKEKEAKDKEMEKELKIRKRNAKINAKKKKEDRIQYSRNIKIGALRLGNKMIFISRYGANNDNRRVFVIEKAENTHKKSIFRAYYYIFQNGVLVDANMENAKRYIDEEYKAYFKIVNDRKQNASNFLFVSSLREIQNKKGELQPQLNESSKHSDIYFCERKHLESLQESPLWDSIDVSLKTYLSLLYLKSDQMKISLIIGDHKQIEINNSQIFDKIDTLVKSQKLIDLEPALDLSNCSIIEAYYNKANSRIRQLNRKNTAFHFLNGVLFYHENRLITRYCYNFGQISKLFMNKLKTVQQILIMFGFIEIKKEFSVNIFKTGFVRDDLLEEIYNRLKFVQKYAQKLTRDGKEQSRRPPEEKSEPKKKFKPNEEGKDGKQEVYQID